MQKVAGCLVTTLLAAVGFGILMGTLGGGTENIYRSLLLFSPLFLILAGILVVGAVFQKRPQGQYGAHFATARETADMRPQKRRKSGSAESTGKSVLLANQGGRILEVAPGFDGRREMGHFLVAAPSRAGKGLHLVSNLMTWKGSTIANDIKGELYATTAQKRRALGNEILVLDPSGRGHRYDPFAELSYSPQALRSAVELVMEPDKSRDPTFAQRASYAMYAAALGARIEGSPTLPYIREITSEGPRTFVEHLDGLGDREVRRALVDFLGDRPEDMEPRDYRTDRFLSSTWGTMTTRLGPFFADGVLRMCGGSDFRAADLVQQPSSLYLMFSESELRYTKKVFQVVLMSLISGLIRHGDLEPGEGVPLLIALDEAGRTPIPQLDDMVSTISGRGMSALIYVQDISQLEAAYGREEARTIRGNCHTQIYYRPADYETAAAISRMSGMKSVEDVRVNRDNIGWSQGHSLGAGHRELITPDEVQDIAHDEVFVMVGGKPPIRAKRLEWFRDVPGAAAFAQAHPPEAPPELPAPELPALSPGSAAPGKKQIGPAESPDGAGGGHDRRDDDEGRENRGYYEPEF